MPHPLMTYSSSSGSTGSNDFIPGMKDLRRSSSQISLSSSIQSNVYANVWKVSLLNLQPSTLVFMHTVARLYLLLLSP